MPTGHRTSAFSKASSRSQLPAVLGSSQAGLAGPYPYSSTCIVGAHLSLCLLMEVSLSSPFPSDFPCLLSPSMLPQPPPASFPPIPPPPCAATSIHLGHPITFFFFSFSFCLFRASRAAYENSQARGRIGAAISGLHHSHSNLGSEPRL